MGLDMSLVKMPRFGGTTVAEVSAIESYLSKEEKRDEEYEGMKISEYSLEEWAGIPESALPDKETIEYYKQFYTTKYWGFDTEKRYGHKAIMEEIARWRKANAIHNWFVENIQGGEDDCCYHREVGKEDLEALRDACVKVLEESVMVNSKVKNGFVIQNGEVKEVFADGEIVINPEVAEELLPTKNGFFFGSTEYSGWYIEDLKYTAEIIDGILKTTDFDKEMIYYSSSW